MALPVINHLAVLVAAVVTFGFGAVWYSPAMLGKRWMAAHGHTPEKLAAMQQGMARIYGVTFLCWLVMAAALAILVGRIGVDTAEGGLKLGTLCWAGFAATIGLSGNMFSEKPLAAWLIDAGYQLISFMAAAVILALWQ